MEKTKPQCCPRRPGGKWIWVEPDYRNDVQVGWFRRRFRWYGDTRRVDISISADTRFRAWWNDERLGRGPSAGDLAHWSYETFTVDLKSGENCLSIEVLHQGRFESLKYISFRPALIAWTDDEALNAVIASDGSWHCRLSDAHAAKPQTSQSILPAYTAVGGLERVDGRKLPEGWQSVDFDDSSWRTACELPVFTHYKTGCGAQELSWSLTPSGLPPLTEEVRTWRKPMEAGRMEAPADVPWSDGLRQKTAAEGSSAEAADVHCFPADGMPQYLILDAGEMTTAFVSVELVGGAGTELSLRYAEALSEDLVKNRRDGDAAGDVEGFYDHYTLREGRQTYEPFFWRPFRFLKLVVSGHSKPVRLRSVTLRRCVYPGDPVAAFHSNSDLLERIQHVSWRTAQLCAHDTHDDCPYYEQLPYAGDLRLHGPVGAMMTGDFRLLERSIRMYAWSRQSDGMILTRYPARVPQIIPPFALIWIQLVEEFYQMTDREEFIREMFPVIRDILAWFERLRCPERILKKPFPYWNFTDWSIPANEGAENNAGNRASLMMFTIGALQAAGRMAVVAGERKLETEYAGAAAELKTQCFDRLWDPEVSLLRDDINEPARAVHQTILALLYEVLPAEIEMAAFDAVLQADEKYQPTVPFSFYLFRAASRLNAYDRVWPRIRVWEDMLSSGTTTWFEMPEPTRSDCHAWSSWILRDFFTEILGIHPLRPGFREVLIRPRFVKGLDRAEGMLPTCAGGVSVNWRRSTRGKVEIEVELPETCQGGVLEINGERFLLRPGRNRKEV